jgi:glycerol-3-phosphate O-acyltransferase
MMPEYPLPEFLRSARALAIASAPGSNHDIVFAPLLRARRAAQEATSLEGQLDAFDAQRLDRAWRGAIASLAARAHPRVLPDRRAMAAELELLATPLWRALEQLQHAADAGRTASPATQRRAWERWTEQVRAVIRAADAWWEAALPVLADSQGRRGALWRRLLRQRR